MRAEIVAVAVLAASGLGIFAIDHQDREVLNTFVSVAAKQDSVVKPVNSHDIMGGAYKEYEEKVRKEQSDSKNKEKWAAAAKEFDAPMAHCPTSKECE